MKTITQSGIAYAESFDETSAKIKYIFTDYKPNANKQGVRKAEAENITASAIFMPIKINYKNGPTGHAGAFPVGLITSMEADEEVITGEGLIWRKEFPEVVEYLESHKETGVQFSWEMLYATSEKEDDTEWLSGCKTVGLTIVDRPAYEGRTPMLAIAEKNMEELQTKLDELTAQFSAANQRITELESSSAAIEAQASENLTALQTELETATSELETLRLFKAETERAEAEASTLSNRFSAITAAGINMNQTQFNHRKVSILEMSDSLFNQYVNDLAAATKSTIATSSIHAFDVPDSVREQSSDEDEQITKALIEALRQK